MKAVSRIVSKCFLWVNSTMLFTKPYLIERGGGINKTAYSISIALLTVKSLFFCGNHVFEVVLTKVLTKLISMVEGNSDSGTEKANKVNSLEIIEMILTSHKLL